MNYETKDSGTRAEFDSGMVRDTEAGKPRFDLLLPLGIPYEEQMLTRDALLMARGAAKYDARNWELAKGEAELARYRSSALRHLMQWIAGETDEDHAAAVRFNIMAGETVSYKLRSDTEAMVRLAGQGLMSQETALRHFFGGDEKPSISLHVCDCPGRPYGHNDGCPRKEARPFA